MNLRYIERDGKMVLQFKPEDHTDDGATYRYLAWEDVPTVEVPTSQQKPKEFWISNFDVLNFETEVTDYQQPCWKNAIHVREVLPGSVQVTKGQLAEIWDIARNCGISASNSSTFNNKCRALGLGEDE